MKLDHALRRTLERRFTGEQTVSNDAETVDVGARVEGFAATLFRRHVIRSAHYGTDGSQVFVQRRQGFDQCG